MRGERGLLIGAIVTTVVGFGPLAIALTAGAIADSAGCVLNEGDVHPCFIAGHDFGNTLYAMGMMGWLMLLTMWFVIPAIALWIAWVVTVARGRRTPPPVSPAPAPAPPR